ncbi:hydroxyacid dehydrogenase [Frankia sp. CcI49]|uniref:2-hydroxyacid dehydrogenase n=1 Tax=unclassified Frankia TaxID=2632575 RepID=UPI0006CA2810|nr:MULTISPECIES: 2-hydroxyacid dehydrogenase [unclassified Frankia]KPM54234.1 2-hydroxyacid dehydrogenase [Frankia sp. R43]ONH61661.1 hydroxyacid dehydrogenase [Frankia sp. CcI49]
MRVAVFSAKDYDRRFLGAARPAGIDLDFLEHRLTARTAGLARGFDAVCVFVEDDVSAPVLDALAAGGIRLVVLRSAGYDNVDLARAGAVGITVARVPAYSPHAVAEHAVALILALNRHLCRAYNRVREYNFALTGLLGFDLHGRTVGVVGTGEIGTVFTRIMTGFGCRVLAHDLRVNPVCAELGAEYVDLDRLLADADIISLHCPLTQDTHHLLDSAALARTKQGVMVINTSRGALLDTGAVIAALKKGRIGALGIDVYEEESALFFEDRSEHGAFDDDVFARLLTFPNVLVTGHQGFFTVDALTRIAEVTMANLSGFAGGTGPVHPVTAVG